MVERDVALAVRLVVEHAMALAERTTAAILAGEPHGSSLEKQGAEGERLGEGPVVGATSLPDLLAPLEQYALDLRQHMKFLRNSGQRLGDEIEVLLGDRGVDRSVRIGRLENGRRTGEFVRLRLLSRGELDLGKSVVELLE